METRNIGSLRVTVAGIGCNNFGWRIDADATAAVVNAAIEQGVNFFDTADIYGTGQSEEYLGRALGNRRKDVIVATKFGMKMSDQKSGAKPEYIHQAVEDSLRRLGTDYIDLYQLHQPDANTPISDTLGALHELVQAGKVREIGCSNFSKAQLEEADKAGNGKSKFVSVQNQYSMVHRDPEAEVLPECVKLGMAFLPYFPLANGLLTGKYKKGEAAPEGSRAKDGFGPKVFTDKNLELVEDLTRYAEAHGHSMLDLAVSWLLAQPAVTSVIAGSKSPEQVKSNAAAANWRLSQSEVSEIGAILAQHG